jgi:hypothetical protein
VQLARLEREVARLAMALERSQQGEAELRTLLAAATQPRQLAAPVDTIATRAVTAENGSTAPEPTPTTSPRPWWRFWGR